MTARYAVYFAPADHSPLAVFGQALLARTADELLTSHQASQYLSQHLTNTDNLMPPDCAFLQRLVKTPRHYGFHATLKAPFELAEGKTAAELCTAVSRFAAQETPLALTGLHPVVKSGFLALRLLHQPDSVQAFAFRCVQQFEAYRAPLSEYDIERRKPDTLSAHQRDNLMRYGYPHIKDAFDFHMTLSSRLSAGEADRTANKPTDSVDTKPETKHTPLNEDQQDVAASEQSAIGWIDALYKTLVPEDPVLDRVAVYYQPDRQSHFVRHFEATLV